MAAQVDCQLPSAGLHRPVSSPSRAFQARPTTSGCLSLAQLKELYSDASKLPRCSKSRASPNSSAGPSPQSSPVRSGTRHATQSCSPSSTSPDSSPLLSSSPCSRNGTGDVPAAQSLRPARSRLGRSPSTATPAEARVDSLDSFNQAQTCTGRNSLSAGGRVQNAAEAMPFIKSHSLQSDRLSKKGGLKSALAEDRELRHVRSLGRRVSFNNEIEVILYPQDGAKH